MQQSHAQQIYIFVNYIIGLLLLMHFYVVAWGSEHTDG